MGVYIPNMEKPKDGLYQIDHGKIHKYKGKGGTVRIYDLIEIPSELDVMTLKSEAEALGYVAIKKSEFETYQNAYILQQIRSGNDDSNT